MLSTSEVADASGYSAQQVRDLAELGVIPPAARAANGYRQFDQTHLAALATYRDLALAVGPAQARALMRELPTVARTSGVAHAVALVGDLHVRLAREREQALAARSALQAIHGEATDGVSEPAEDSMTISELSEALGVRPSTLRFWEAAGLVAPERVGQHRHPGSGRPVAGARLYHLAAIREARIAAALRAGGYRIPAVREAIAAVRDLAEVGQSVAALEARLEVLAQRWLALLRAGAALGRSIEVAYGSGGPVGGRGQEGH